MMAMTEVREARYQIGEVAERTGVTQRTLRFYEEKGLLTPSERMEGGFRLYSDQDVERIEMIKKLQGLLNLSLADIKDMVEAEEIRAQIRATFSPDRTLPARRERVTKVIAAVRRQLEIVETKLTALEEMRHDLRDRLTNVETRLEQIDEAIATGEGSTEPAPEQPART